MNWPLSPDEAARNSVPINIPFQNWICGTRHSPGWHNKNKIHLYSLQYNESFFSITGASKRLTPGFINYKDTTEMLCYTTRQLQFCSFVQAVDVRNSNRSNCRRIESFLVEDNTPMRTPDCEENTRLEMGHIEF